MNEFLSVTNASSTAEKIIILIPDIWGLTDYNQATAQNFADKYQRPCYILDYFYQLTGKPSKFDQAADPSTAPTLMDKMTGEDFVAIFNKAINEIKLSQPNLSSITVIGFCFGGRLAYLSGLEKLVDKIVSFYGAGSAKPGFYQTKSAVDALCSARHDDKSLQVLAFYGTNDASISEADRQYVASAFGASSILYEHHEYPAGHAYYQEGRPSYDQSAAQQSNEVLDGFLV